MCMCVCVCALLSVKTSIAIYIGMVWFLAKWISCKTRFAWFLEIAFVREVGSYACLCVTVCVCVFAWVCVRVNVVTHHFLFAPPLCMTIFLCLPQSSY